MWLCLWLCLWGVVWCDEWPDGGLRVDVCHDVFDPCVVLKAVYGKVLAVSDVLEATVWHLGNEGNVGVDPDIRGPAITRVDDVQSWPVSRPPVMTLNVPAGRNSEAISARSRVVSGVVSLGLRTTVLPAASAGAIFQIAIIIG